VSQFQLLK